MTNDEKKNISIAVLATIAGCMAIALIFLYANGGPAPSTSSGSNPGTAAPAPAAPPQPHKPATTLYQTPKTTDSGLSYPGDAPPPGGTPAPEFSPVYEWVKAGTKELVLNRGQLLAYGPIPAAGTVIHYDVKSTMPVNTGIVDESWLHDAHVWDHLTPDMARCYEWNILSTAKQCDLQPENSGAIFVQDPRNADGAIGAAIGAYLGAKEPLRRQTGENRVTLTFYEWSCTNHCPPGVPRTYVLKR